MARIINEILEARAESDDDTYLWLHSSGECILWQNKDSSLNGDGKGVIDRWQLTEEVSEELIELGEVDGYGGHGHR